MLIHRALDDVRADLGADVVAIRVAGDVAGTGYLACCSPDGLVRDGEAWPLPEPLPPPGLVGGQQAKGAMVPTALRLALAAPPRAVLTLPLGDSRSTWGGAFTLFAAWGSGPPPDGVAERVGAARLADLGARAAEYERVRRLELAAAHAGAILAVLEQAVVVIDDVRAMATANPAAARLLGVSEGELPGADMQRALVALQRTVVNSEAPREVQAGLMVNPALVVSGSIWELDHGPPRFLSVSTHPVAGAGVTGRVWVFDDVTEQVRARREAEQAEARFRLLAENASDVVMSGDNNGIWTWISPSVERLLGWHPDELVGTPFIEMLHPDDHGTARDAQISLMDGQPVLFDTRMRRRDGTYRWISISARPVLDERGNVVGRVGGWRDIQPQREQWRTVADALEGMRGSGIVIFDRDMRYLVVRGGALLHTIADASWEGRRMPEVVAPPEQPRVRAMYARALSGEVTEYESTTDIGGTLLVRITPMRDMSGAVVGGAALVTDITDRVRGERATKEQNLRLLEMDRLKDRMIATVSHELRTPVTSLSLLLDVLADDDGLPDATRQLVDVGERSATRLRRLVEDLLLLAEAEHDGLSLTLGPVDPGEIVQDAAAELGALAADARVEVRVEVAPVAGAVGDHLRLAQVVLNLAGNAIKFTPPGGQVTLRVRPAAAGWVLGVHDTGIGIPADDIARLFDPFFRASTATEAVIGGTGLGLAVVQQIVLGHGGTARVTSEVGAGTDVEITFPLDPSDGGAG